MVLLFLSGGALDIVEGYVLNLKGSKMDTIVSPVVERADCLWVIMDQHQSLNSMLEGAKKLSTDEGKMVAFVFYAGTTGCVFNVTARSNIGDMTQRFFRTHFNRYDHTMLII